jgi:hypothetical protein
MNKALFSNFVTIRERKMIDLALTLTLDFIFEKRAAYIIKMHKKAISTLKSAFGF